MRLTLFQMLVSILSVALPFVMAGANHATFFGCCVLAADEPISIEPGRRQLFLDDFVVEKMDGVKRTMHQPEKRGAVFRPYFPNGGAIQTRSAPMWIPDEKRFKLVYKAFPADAPAYTAIAVSSDGLHWERPALPGQSDNRIVVPTLPGLHDKFYNVVHDPDDPDASRRYKGLQGATGRVAVVSPDCMNWRLIESAKLKSSDESNLTYDRENNRFFALLKTGNKYGRAYNISFSEDFVHWSKPQFCFGADAKDQERALQVIRERLTHPGLARPMFIDPDPATGWRKPEYHRIPTWRAECYNIGVFPYEGVYIGLPMIYFPCGIRQPERNNADGFHLIQLAMSRDLVNWKRLGDRRAFIGPSRIDDGLVGVFDRMQLAPFNRPVEREDELWFYYVGFKWRVPIYDRYTDGSPRDPETLTPEQMADLKDGTSAVCLAVLRRDGFISVDAGDEEGTVLTKPLKLAGSRLMLNLDAAEGGRIEVDILDQAGQPIPAYSGDDAIAVTGNDVRTAVSWRDQSELTSLEGNVVRLRFRLKDASLYAFWTE